MKFKTTLLSAGKTATGIEIPPEVIEKLDAGRKPAVAVTINGFTYRSTVASRGYRFLVGVSAENREQAGVAAGDELEVELVLDTAPREIEVPSDLAVELKVRREGQEFLREPHLQPAALVRRADRRRQAARDARAAGRQGLGDAARGPQAVASLCLLSRRSQRRHRPARGGTGPDAQRDRPRRPAQLSVA